MKNTKRCFVLFSFYDRTGIEAFLEKQAESGWMLDSRYNKSFQIRYDWKRSTSATDSTGSSLQK